MNNTNPVNAIQMFFDGQDNFDGMVTIEVFRKKGCAPLGLFKAKNNWQWNLLDGDQERIFFDEKTARERFEVLRLERLKTQGRFESLRDFFTGTAA